MQVLAHRGASGHAPENTLASINLALTAPVFGVEIDIFQVEDDYILMHDRWLTRTTGEKIRIDQVTLDQIDQLSAGHHLDEPQKVPKLSDVLALDWQDKVLNIEVKAIRSVAHLHSYIQTHCPPELKNHQILLSSFNHLVLYEAQQQHLPYQRGWLTASMPVGLALEAQALECGYLGIDIDVVNQAIVNDAHSRGVKVAVFTVDEIDDIEWLYRLGVDAIFANYPVSATNIIQALR
ncbi:glycerophosphodiester phosphodiesterase [Alteromonas facilis]|uniref:glycerophosphodiester phosphodiesterase n=1 Tax=Alteromonas facilis TaxID=2048004 RepID=UPI000C285A7B|nr:glycerophosphodiester phosphodiesterase [Alteromonas facilis]